MKVLGRIVAMVLTALFLTANLCYSESTDENINGKKTEPPTYSSAGAGYLKKGMFDKAIAEFSKAIKENPKNADAYYNRGIAYYYKGQYDQAVSDFNKALEINPGDIRAYKGRGLAYQNKGQYDAAISDYNNAITEMNSIYGEIHINRGVAYAKGKGRYDDAISDYTKAIEINPKNALAYYNRGIAYQSKGRHDDAISDYTKAIEINPRYGAAYYNRGLAYAKGKGRYDDAISDYTKAIEINPGNVKVYNNRGIAYQNKGKYDQAISDFDKAIELNPRYAAAYYNRGLAYAGKGDLDQATSDYNKAVEIDPKYAESVYRDVYAKKSQTASSYNKTLKINPIYSDNYKNRALVYVEEGKYDQAISDFNKALEANPRDAKAYYHRGVTYYSKGQYDKATADFNKSIELDPDYDRPINGLAYILALDSKQLNNALELSRHSLELKPDEPYYWITLAEIYYRLGRISNAKIANNNARRFAKEESLIKLVGEQRQRLEEKTISKSEKKEQSIAAEQTPSPVEVIEKKSEPKTSETEEGKNPIPSPTPFVEKPIKTEIENKEATKEDTETIPPTESGGKYTIQIGSFKTEEEAKEAAEDLISKGYPAFVITAQTSGKSRWYRVGVGTFDTVKEAKIYRDKLKSLERSMESAFITVNN